MTTENHEKPPAEVEDFANQMNCRVTAIEEALLARRPAYAEYKVESLETEDGPLHRVVGPDGKTLSPLFFSWNCLQTYISRIPLLTHEEWDNCPLILTPEEVPQEKKDETNP